MYTVAYDVSSEISTRVMDTMPHSCGHVRRTGAMMDRISVASMRERFDMHGVYTGAMPARFSVLFCGTSLFAVPSLECLVADPDFDILGVITQPDRPTGRKQVLTPPPVKMRAIEHGLNIFQPEKINTDPVISTLPRPDFLVVVSFGQILSQAILDMPSIMPVNVHASLLPRWRGASPIQQAILTGDHETGVTVQKMVKELDAGPILSQRKTPVAPTETAVSLHDRLAALGGMLLVETLKKPLNPVDQDESDITVCRKLTREDGQADPNTDTAQEIDRKWRALMPWPGVTMTVNGEQLKILETSLENTPEAYPLTCRGNSTLFLVKVQSPGGKPVSGMEWSRGRREI